MAFDTSKATKTGVPDGDYIGTIVSGEERANKAGNGRFVHLRWRMDTGAEFNSYYNIENPNVMAQNIGLADLKEIQISCGIQPGSGEAEDLVGKVMQVTVENKRGSNGRENVNITRYSAIPEGGEIQF